MEEIEKALRKKLNAEVADKTAAKPAAESTCEAAAAEKPEKPAAEEETGDGSDCEAAEKKEEVKKIEGALDVVRTAKKTQHEAEVHPHSFFAPIGSSKFADTEELKRELEAKQEELEKVKKANDALEKANQALESKKPEPCKGGICAKSLTLVKNGSLKQSLKESKEQADK